jgi:hypothetical protein
MIETMHFYGWDWEKMLSIRLKFFWTLTKNMNRIKAAEALRLAKIMSVGQMDQQSREGFIRQQEEVLGKICVSDERDEEAIERLKLM